MDRVKLITAILAECKRYDESYFGRVLLGLSDNNLVALAIDLGIDTDAILAPEELFSRLDQAMALFEHALIKATGAVKIANEELTRPLTKEDISERDHEELNS